MPNHPLLPCLAFALYFGVPTGASALPTQPHWDYFQTCNPIGLTSTRDRVHVECLNATPEGIRFWAVPGANTAEASRLIRFVIDAMVARSTITIHYALSDIYDNKTGPEFGCLFDNCRRVRILSRGIPLTK